HESKAIIEIVDTILNTLFPLNSKVDEDLVGMKTRLQFLKQILEIGSDGVRMVGIWGVGGGGKTTLANSLYTEISQHFQGHCIVENIREKTSKHDLNILQENMLSAIFKKEKKIYSVLEGKNMIKNMLRGRKVLLILDDVDKLDQLEALAGKHDWFGSGSRIIITTRDEHLLRTHKVDEVCNVQLLSYDEAMQLFNRHAYNEKVSIEDYETLSSRVVSYAAGLPLALKVLGSFLYDKTKEEWLSTLDRLKDVPENAVVEKLKISYDGLKNVEKELFLDIACFFIWSLEEHIMEILEACDFHPKIGIAVLREKALISIVNGMFDMHDLVQEMAHYIVRGEDPKNPDKHSRIWKRKEIVNMRFEDATTKLRYLEVQTRDPTNVEVEGPAFLSNELRYFSWRPYPARSLFPDGFQPLKLVVLKLNGRFLKEVWKGCKLLPHLKVLQLSGMEKLLRTPNFDGLWCLQKLTLSDCPKLKRDSPVTWKSYMHSICKCIIL
ncbi:hypothetical protein R6Q59_036196, partial [Mikania micrantha]